MYSAIRLTRLAVSSSELPVGRKTLSESLKQPGGEVPNIIARRVLPRASVPISTAAFHAEYGMPSGPTAQGLALKKEFDVISSRDFTYI